MNKKKVLKIIPYIVLAVGIVLTLSAYVTMQTIENKCNEHWVKQLEQYKQRCSFVGSYPEAINISFDTLNISWGSMND